MINITTNNNSSYDHDHDNHEEHHHKHKRYIAVFDPESGNVVPLNSEALLVAGNLEFIKALVNHDEEAQEDAEDMGIPLLGALPPMVLDMAIIVSEEINDDEHDFDDEDSDDNDAEEK